MVRELLGHAKLDTTQGYVWVEREALREAIEVLNFDAEPDWRANASGQNLGRLGRERYTESHDESFPRPLLEPRVDRGVG